MLVPGIDLTCEGSEYFGEFTYHDHGAKFEMADGNMRHISIRAWVGLNEIPNGGSCGDYYLDTFTQFDFDYRTQPDKSGEVGTGNIQLWDADLTGSLDDRDKLCIEIYTGPYEGYINCGDLGGGNLTIYDE